MKLSVMNGKMEGYSSGATKDIMFIGRSRDNDILIRDPAVSKRHARIIQKENRAFIEDLNSRNGTKMEGHLLKPGNMYEIIEGLPIAIGKTLFSFYRPESEGGMVTQCSINMAGMIKEGKKNLIYKDRRVTNRRNLELMYEVSNKLMLSTDINKICEEIMNSLFHHLNRIDSGAILLMEKETGRIRELFARSKDKNLREGWHYSRTIVNRVIAEGKAVIMSDTRYEDKDDLSESIEMMKIRSIMCVPLIFKSNAKGVIYVHSVNVPNGFHREDLNLFTALSSPAALAIENALMYSERKLTERKLQESEDQYRFLVENAKDAIVVVGKGVIHFANNAAVELWGCDENGIKGVKFIDLFDSRYKESLIRNLLSTMKGGDASDEGPYRISNKKGIEKWVQISGSPIQWQGNPSILYFIRNITKSKRRKTLSIFTHKMEAIHTMASGISHELNNLLMGIQGNVSLIMFDLSEESPHLTRLKEIERFVEKGAKITEGLLGFTRNEEYITRPCDLNRILTDTSDTFGIYKDNIQIHRNFKKDLKPVKIDKGQMESVLLALYDNAWEAMECKGGKFYLKSRDVNLDSERGEDLGLAPGNYVMVSITDTGEALDKETQLRIFDPYFSSWKMGRGKGIGLASVYWIIRNYGGTINVSSERGKGNTFKIFIPVEH